MSISDWSSDVCSSDLRSRIKRVLCRHFGFLAEFDCQRVVPAGSGAFIAERIAAAGIRRDPCIGDAVDRAQRGVVGVERKIARIRILPRSEEHTSELQSLMRISYAGFCLKKKNIPKT